MELLRLVIVDDEPILLQGLIETYDWKSMGFEIAGSAQSGEEAIRVIRETQPHVVLTDIRMKQITGLMVMEEIQKENMECLFIVLSAYRDFEYAQQAVELGAFAYLVKPVEDDKLQETMGNAYRTCMEQMKNEAKYESWEKIMIKDTTSFLQVIVQKYVQNILPDEKVEEVFGAIGNVIEEGDKFITVFVDLDIEYKITNALDYETARFAMAQSLEEVIKKDYFYWKCESGEGNIVFIIKTPDNAAVRDLKRMLEHVKKEEKRPVVAAISKPYRGIRGIKRSWEEAQNLFGIASISGASAFTIPEELEETAGKAYPADAENRIANAVRRNDEEELKQAFIQFIYSLPQGDELQARYIHKMMLKAEFLIKDSYGMTEELKAQFQNYYSNLKNLNAARAVDVCYKILCGAVEKRREAGTKDETKYFKEYMSVAIAYIEEHLDDENLTIVSVATHIYLNPVYFGRVFKNTFHMTFKQYLLRQRIEKAKRLLEEGACSIGDICEQVGISNPSYFSHLFKQHTGKLPSEYRKDIEESGKTGRTDTESKRE